MFYVWSVVCLAGFILIHLSAKYLTFLARLPRSKVLSAGGGVSVAYVFIHVLPELNAHQERVSEQTGPALLFVDHHVYLVALIGLAAFYGMERLVNQTKVQPSSQDQTSGKASVFWLHMLFFGGYNALIAYLLIRGEEKSIEEMVVYFAAFAIHFVINDHSLRATHEAVYDRYGRWVLAIGILAGGLIGEFIVFRPWTIAVLFSFLAGSVLLNVLKEELPEERQSSFGAFAGGAALYTLLLLGL